MYFPRFDNLGTPLARCFADRDLRGDLLPGLSHRPISSLLAHPLPTFAYSRAVPRRSFATLCAELRRNFARPSRLRRRPSEKVLLGVSTVIVPSDISSAGWLLTGVSGGTETPLLMRFAV